MGKTTIPVQSETRDKLKKLGRMDEKWDDLINRLADNHLDLTLGEVEALYSIAGAVDDADDPDLMRNCISGSQKLYKLMQMMKKGV